MAEEKVVDFIAATIEAKAAFLKGVKWTENAGVLFIDKEGEFSKVNSHVCHANLRCGRGSKIVINGLMIGTSYGTNPGRILATEIELWFVDYILNRSAYSQVFIEKDARRALEERMVVVSGDHPGNLLGAALVALRRLWEYVFVAQAAYDLAKLGVNEDLAYFLGHFIATKNNATAHDVASWAECRSGHCSLNPATFGFTNLRNFLDHTVKQPNASYSAGGSYDNYDRLYGEGEGGYVRRYITANFPKHLYKKQVAKSTLNPFAAAVKDPDDGHSDKTTYGKAIEVMAEWAKTHLMEKIYA